MRWRPLVPLVLAVGATIPACAETDVEGPRLRKSTKDRKDGGTPVERTPDSATAASTPTRWIVPLTPTTFHIPFNTVNPSVSGYGSCFGRPLNQLVHAAEDRGAAAGTPVVAVGDGEVVFAAPASYPGAVIVIRHDLSPEDQAALGTMTSSIYSQYGHLNEPEVQVGQRVKVGERIGTLLNQGSNSHLHWEMRTVMIPQLCGSTIPGPGYTGPGTDARDYGYIDPTETIERLR